MSAKIVAAAMRRAYFLGQTFWQQADSDFVSQHKKSDMTASVFQALAEETIATVDALQARIDELEAQLFIAQADAALPLFEVMHLEPVTFPTIRP